MLRVLEETGCDPSVAIVDFERGVEHAFHSVYGDLMIIQYCVYYLTQSILVSLGLTSLYEADDDFRVLRPNRCTCLSPYR